MKNIIFWYRLFDIIWISIIALLANHIFVLKVNFCNSLNWGEIIKISLLIMSIIFFNIFFFNYKKIIEEANEKYQKQVISFTLDEHFSWETKDTICNKKWNSSSQKIPYLIMSFILLLLYLYDWNSLL